MFNPVEQSLAQLPHGLGQLGGDLDLVKPPARKNDRQVPTAFRQRTQPGPSAFLAFETARLPEVKSRKFAEPVPAVRAAFDRRKISTELDRPERKVGQR